MSVFCSNLSINMRRPNISAKVNKITIVSNKLAYLPLSPLAFSLSHARYSLAYIVWHTTLSKYLIFCHSNLFESRLNEIPFEFDRQSARRAQFVRISKAHCFHIFRLYWKRTTSATTTPNMTGELTDETVSASVEKGKAAVKNIQNALTANETSGIKSGILNKFQMLTSDQINSIVQSNAFIWMKLFHKQVSTFCTQNANLTKKSDYRRRFQMYSFYTIQSSVCSTIWCYLWRLWYCPLYLWIHAAWVLCCPYADVI